METQETASRKGVEPEDNTESSQWWCNFCGFRTDDAKVYLAHSCKDVLAERGVTIEPTGGNECR